MTRTLGGLEQALIWTPLLLRTCCNQVGPAGMTPHIISTLSLTFDINATRYLPPLPPSYGLLSKCNVIIDYGGASHAKRETYASGLITQLFCIYRMLGALGAERGWNTRYCRRGMLSFTPLALLAMGLSATSGVAGKTWLSRRDQSFGPPPLPAQTFDVSRRCCFVTAHLTKVGHRCQSATLGFLLGPISIAGSKTIHTINRMGR